MHVLPSARISKLSCLVIISCLVNSLYGIRMSFDVFEILMYGLTFLKYNLKNLTSDIYAIF